MESLKDQLLELKERLDKVVRGLDLEAKKLKLQELEIESARPDFWNDTRHAQNVMRQAGSIREEMETVDKTEKEINDALSVVTEADLASEVKETIKQVEKVIDKIEVLTFLSGSYDKNDAIVSIHSGQGGTEAMDWAQMLFRMYLRFFERRGWEAEVVDQQAGEEAGIKSATMTVSGAYAYGYLKREAGTHRLVRQSPFNANKLRQTSFALVEVMPQLEEAGEIEIKDEEVEIQFFRAGGHGGQNVNKVSTAVRLTHLPTGIVVTAQTERFQEQNRKIALALLRAKLFIRREAEQEAHAKSIKGDYRPAAWGTQIRSYVLHPYKMVKDLRTDVETGNTDAVLDGDLEAFVEAELKFRAGDLHG
ncbi:MAG: peptide chain release factor 2 [Microgenomates group bacterium Gr01-1014_5]|nr:MAG: peptide chain release factor 2 [Microgenomates group bacterium Gr01-1014_5]